MAFPISSIYAIPLFCLCVWSQGLVMVVSATPLIFMIENFQSYSKATSAMKRKTIASDLGIDLASHGEEELFKWLLACLLFGKPIQTSIAEQAYRTIVAAHLRSPDAILRAGWDKLVDLLDQAHYVRYDFSTATKLLEISKELKRRYRNVTNLIAQSKSLRELSAKLQEFKNVGPVTARIFLRELRPHWRSYSQAGRVRVESES